MNSKSMQNEDEIDVLQSRQSINDSKLGLCCRAATALTSCHHGDPKEGMPSEHQQGDEALTANGRALNHPRAGKADAKKERGACYSFVMVSV